MITIHTSLNYSAYLMNNSGLIVEHNRKKGGIQLKPNHPQYCEYVDALRTAIDSKEADALCKALVQA
jgi:hypothetical protein